MFKILRPVSLSLRQVHGCMSRKCKVCGKAFTPVRVTQVYCSAACRRYANHRSRPQTWPDHVPGAAVIREFDCVRCGKHVKVTDQQDCRTKFCSQKCERYYWKHPGKASAQTVKREFYCRECGKHVIVTDPKDRRRSFCSAACGRHWADTHRSDRRTNRRKIPPARMQTGEYQRRNAYESHIQSNME